MSLIRGAYWNRYRAGFTGFAALAVSIAPLFIVGLLSVPIRQEFGDSRAGLGLAVSAFMGAAVFSAPIAGRLVDRLGVNVVLRLGIIVVVMSDVWIGLISSGSSALRIGMALGGLGLSLVDAGSTIDVKLEVRHDAQAMAFGIKETAGPITPMLGGVLIVPLAAATSWRSIFLIYGCFAFALLVVDLTLDREHGRTVWKAGPGNPIVELFSGARLVAMAVALAMIGITAITTYGIDASLVAGMSAQSAGLWITGGSAGAIVTRIVTAYAMRHSEPRGTLIVVSLIALGGLGHLLLASGWQAAMIPGGLVALGLGWGWGGVLFLFVIRLYPLRSGRAVGIVFMGAYAGGVLGPPVFGWVVDSMGFRAAWLFSALCMVIAAGILVIALAPLRRSDTPSETLA